MKKIVIVLLAALLVLGTVACQAQKQAEEPAAEPAEEPAPVETGAMAGGWTPAADYEVTEERKAVFDKGVAALLGVDYEPLAYLGSQMVAGTNHVFLVKGTAVVPTRPVSYALVYLYEDLQGNVKLMNIADLGIVPNEDGTVTPPEEGPMGAWYYADDPTVTDEMLTRLDQALEGMVGASYAPVANLGEQVVAGLNRCLLCQVTPVVPDAQPHYALVYVYEKLDGGAELLQVIGLDVGALCTYGA